MNSDGDDFAPVPISLIWLCTHGIPSCCLVSSHETWYKWKMSSRKRAFQYAVSYDSTLPKNIPDCFLESVCFHVSKRAKIEFIKVCMMSAVHAQQARQLKIHSNC